MQVQQIDSRKVRPSEYLKNGFFNKAGDWIEDLNGSFSLATTYYLQNEGIAPEKVKKIADHLMALSLEVFGDAEIIEYQPIDDILCEAISEIMDSDEVRESAVLTELFEAVRPHLKNWKTFAALVIHLERIANQFSQTLR